ncbi:radical SAM family heme chaperone HemW [Candidatus Cryosericum septentrionale]|uniref:Heme chaperone HemW n=1 Tax=Candidatus Cryosericum septentrionale TaxID=2290913 RepID=A0A398DZR3_9BACT|nr:radical SAM family heme chaperone HemW [Candidatus Cryosericum septentrionale]RIE16814.1 radical SAM family heme chaperone HemW [Candidatus Cryosericum septentrionale]
MSRTTRPVGIYIHIPFCRRRCNYCDFLSTGEATGVPNEYVDALLSEWGLWAETLRRQDLGVRSIYVGGGTPSLLEPLQLRRLIEGVRSAVPAMPDCEITMESNPDSLDAARIRAYAGAGINRLSVGVQSFNDCALERLGRLHDSAGADRALQQAREAGIHNLSLDLMYGLPGSLPGEEVASLRHAIELSPEHISWYNLTLAAGTPLAMSVAEGREVMPDDDTVLGTMREGWSLLAESGFEHYEISNFARPGFVSQHNLGYWLFTDYVGLGLGASGFVSGKRWTNVSNMAVYLAAVLGGRFPVESEERLEGRFREGEYAMLRMRLPGAGLDFATFSELFRDDAQVVFREAFARLMGDGLISVLEDRAVCTQKGLELNNLVAGALI